MAHRSDDIVQVVEWFRTFVRSRRWQEGKADPSHEYTIRNWHPDGVDDFEQAVEVIRELGQPSTFESRTYEYVRVDEMKYWAMGEPVSVTTVLNRAEA
jgi:hypothetical protein